jgi:hypothetical protein
MVSSLSHTCGVNKHVATGSQPENVKVPTTPFVPSQCVNGARRLTGA